MNKPKKPAAKTPELDYWGNPVTAADRTRFKAEAAAAQKARAAPPSRPAGDKQKAALTAKQNKSDAAVNAAAKKSLKGRRRGLDELLKNF